MAFFSFSLIKDPFVYLSTNIEPNKKYYSKDITLSKELNNKNKINSFVDLSYEKRTKITNIGKKLLICLPPKFGVGDAIEYGIAIYSLIQIKKLNPSLINSLLKNIIKNKELINKKEFSESSVPSWFITALNKNKISLKEIIENIANEPSLHLVFKNKNLLKVFKEEHVKTTDLSAFVLKHCAI